MLALQREAFWAKERLLGDLWQSVPPNGRVHLHGVDHAARHKSFLLTVGEPEAKTTTLGGA